MTPLAATDRSDRGCKPASLATHRAPEKPVDRPNRPSYAIRHDGCRECGDGFYGRPEAEFCCDKCRADFNSRRAKRGAELCDLAMAWYQERTLGSLTLLSRACARFWREDKVERPGRKSWFPLAAIIARRPYLRAQRLGQGRKPS